jgi:hypothetical protein
MTWTKWIVAAGSVLGAVGVTFSFFDTYGWITRSVYVQDHENASHEHIASIEKLVKDIKLSQEQNQSQWECDEVDEEIPELELQLSETENNRERIKINREIEKRKERWEDLKCKQFTE